MPSPTLPDDKGDKGLAPPFGTALSPSGSSRKGVSPASPLQSTGAWQPIETAPKDGTSILIYQADGPDHWYAAASWETNLDRWGGDGRGDGWKQMSDPYLSEIEPTHWMPLPAPPQPGK